MSLKIAKKIQKPEIQNKVRTVKQPILRAFGEDISRKSTGTTALLGQP